MTKKNPGPRSRRELTSGALFAGIGGLCIGFKAAGVRTLWANEYDANACATYRANFKKVRLLEKDVRELTVRGDRLEPVDILHAGFPCQSFSQAGDRLGFDDERGKLFFEIIRLVKEFGKNKPPVIVLENAPNIVSGDGGAWFQEIVAQLQLAGYWFRPTNAKVLDLFEYTAIPQKRARLFMVAWSMDHFRDGRTLFPEPPEDSGKDITRFIDFLGRKADHYYLPVENRYFKMIGNRNVDTPKQKHLYHLRKFVIRQKQPNVCPTLTANMGRGGHNVPFIWDRGGLRKLTEDECLKLQGFPASFRFVEKMTPNHLYTQIGNAVAPPIAKLVANTVKAKFLKDYEK
jgi:DNA (cytosine-5)-methyltransferase 1